MADPTGWDGCEDASGHKRAEKVGYIKALKDF
jgi:hypothetical protein